MKPFLDYLENHVSNKKLYFHISTLSESQILFAVCFLHATYLKNNYVILKRLFLLELGSFYWYLYELRMLLPTETID